MVVHDGLEDISINTSNGVQLHSLEHLQDLTIEISAFNFENGVTDDVEIHVRPTNHVYSRKFEHDTDNYANLSATGELIIKYEHYENNPSRVKLDLNQAPIISTDKRVFCPTKYNASKNIPAFIEDLNNFPNKFCVLANSGDDRTCLTGVFEFPEGNTNNNCYIVLFKLHRINTRELSMVIETAFIVEKTDFRAVKIENDTGGKPFLVIVKNIFAKRRPFVGPDKKRSKKKYKKNKKERQKK